MIYDQLQLRDAGFLRLKRMVTAAECPWLERDFLKGEIVYVYHRYTYGCITPGSIAVSYREGQDPFFQLPLDALEPAMARQC
jgi:hypothetical protein